MCRSKNEQKMYHEDIIKSIDREFNHRLLGKGMIGKVASAAREPLYPTHPRRIDTLYKTHHNLY